MKKLTVLLILLAALLAGCHKGDLVFHLLTPEATGVVEVLPTATPTPEVPPLPTVGPQVEPTVHPEEECVVKGNVSASGEKIFHVEGQNNYNTVIIDPEHGERCFDTEEEAVAAGFRKAQR